MSIGFVLHERCRLVCAEPHETRVFPVPGEFSHLTKNTESNKAFSMREDAITTRTA